MIKTWPEARIKVFEIPREDNTEPGFNPVLLDTKNEALRLMVYLRGLGYRPPDRVVGTSDGSVSIDYNCDPCEMIFEVPAPEEGPVSRRILARTLSKKGHGWKVIDESVFGF